MIELFPDPYEDELLYSMVSRYHWYSGNENDGITNKEIYGERHHFTKLKFPTQINKITEKLWDRVDTGEDYIFNHTMIPIYYPFLRKGTQEEILEQMMRQNGTGLKAQLGYAASNRLKDTKLYYCPICCKRDIELYDESYFRRSHQLEGLNYCIEHDCLLKEYIPWTMEPQNYYYIDIEKIDLKEDEIVISEIDKKIGESYLFLLSSRQEKTHLDKLKEKYFEIARCKGYAKALTQVKVNTLLEDLNSFYRKKSSIYDQLKETHLKNAIQKLFRKKHTQVDPLFHILLILFLHGEMNPFLNSNFSFKEKLFGVGPWPCMNIALDKSDDHTIEDIYLTYESKAKQYIGHFICSECGFQYAINAEKYNVEGNRNVKIIEYGEVWQEKLLEEYKTSTSIRELARIMRCDSKTIQKYLKTNKVDSHTKMRLYQSHKKVDNKKEEEYKDKILKCMKDYPNSSRSEIRYRNQSAYTFLYRHNKSWLMKQLPDKRKALSKHKARVNWEQRDRENLELAKEVYQKLKKQLPIIWITKTRIINHLNKPSAIFAYPDKYHRTLSYIESIKETLEDYQRRKIDKVCTSMRNNNDSIVVWKVIREAKIKKPSEEILEYIYQFTDDR